MNKELVDYIEKEIFQFYNKNEEGHGLKHIKTVVERSLKFAKDYDANIDMVYTIAAYHDLGHHIDRKRHEIISAQIFIEDENMKKWFSDEQRKIIKDAIEDHRASSNHEPRSIYGKIVSTADRAILDFETPIKRTYLYGLAHFPNLSNEEHVEEVYNHLKQKFGRNGYAKVYLKDPEFDESLEKFRQALDNKDEFIKIINEIVEKNNL